MAPFLPPPEPSSLLPPLLACLPTAFASSSPPPAVLPLLSPILRQRVQLLSTSTDGPSQSSWLPLLCWESPKASDLVSIVESRDFEPHPVSGEIEVGDVGRPLYRRLDEETLQSALEMSEMGLKAIYVWCESDPEGGDRGWRLSELRPLEDLTSGESRAWSNTVGLADEAFKEFTSSEVLIHDLPSELRPAGLSTAAGARSQDDGEDDYWAQYDNTPSRTPATGLTTSGNVSSGQSNQQASTSEANYFAQYSSVQPEMDSDDPSADRGAIGKSTLHGNEVTRNGGLFQTTSEAPRFQESLREEEIPRKDIIIHTRPSSSSSSVVPQLEQTAESLSHTELAIQHHISTSVKSLFRLARGAGVSRAEFVRLVHTELEVLGMLDDED